MTASPARTRGGPARRARRLLPPARRAWWGDAVALLVTAHLGVVTALWASAGGLSALGEGTASALTSLGRLTGLWASALLLLQVLGMARIPAAERAFGQDRLTAWHRWAGLTSFWLLVAHLVAITFGYAAAAGRNVVVELWSITVTLPGMLLALVGTVALFMVVATSIRAARSRLRYESWHLLHLYAYLGAGLALPHQLWTGTSFITHPWAATYWWTAYGFALGAVLVYRLGMPLVLSRRHRLTVDAVRPDGRGLVTITMTGRDLERLRVEAGQFFIWRFRTGAGWTRGHPLSLSAQPTTAGLRVTMNVTGDDGARIAGMARGTRVLVEGPYGRTTTSARTGRHIAGFAAGAGIAPIIGLLQDNATTGGDTLVYRHSAEHDAALTRDTQQLVQRAGLRYVPLTGPRSIAGTPWLPNEHGHIPGPEAVRRLVAGDLADHDVFVCGPPAWATAVVADVRAAGVADDRIHLESYDW
jgi:predicted ferric reductase